MRAVIYAEDFEPITVIEVGRHALEYIERQGSVNLAVIPPLSLRPGTELLRVYQVHIVAERLCRNGQSTWMLFTRDEEAALLLRSTFLPGQLAAARTAAQEAFGKGFLAALAALGGDNE